MSGDLIFVTTYQNQLFLQTIGQPANSSSENRPSFIMKKHPNSAILFLLGSVTFNHVPYRKLLKYVYDKNSI